MKCQGPDLWKSMRICYPHPTQKKASRQEPSHLNNRPVVNRQPPCCQLTTALLSIFNRPVVNWQRPSCQLTTARLSIDNAPVVNRNLWFLEGVHDFLKESLIPYRPSEMNENPWNSKARTLENRWTSMKFQGPDPWKSMKFKWMFKARTFENQWESMPPLPPPHTHKKKKTAKNHI